MKAVVKLRREAGAVSVIDVPKPSDPKDDEILLRVHSAAICGSDIHAYEFISSYQTFMTIPVVLGHEACGVVEAVGSKVTEFKPGDKVMGESNIYCGKCRNCRLGRWCNLFCVRPLRNKIPPGGQCQPPNYTHQEVQR